MSREAEDNERNRTRGDEGGAGAGALGAGAETNGEQETSPTLSGQGNKGTPGRHERTEGRDPGCELRARELGAGGGRRGEERGVGETHSENRTRGGRGEGGRAREGGTF
eukprot:scaffold166332_cov27-Tisochrysis_lutea.AAC.3